MRTDNPKFNLSGICSKLRNGKKAHTKQKKY